MKQFIYFMALCTGVWLHTRLVWGMLEHQYERIGVLIMLTAIGWAGSRMIATSLSSIVKNRHQVGLDGFWPTFTEGLTNSFSVLIGLALVVLFVQFPTLICDYGLLDRTDKRQTKNFVSVDVDAISAPYDAQIAELRKAATEEKKGLLQAAIGGNADKFWLKEQKKSRDAFNAEISKVEKNKQLAIDKAIANAKKTNDLIQDADFNFRSQLNELKEANYKNVLYTWIVCVLTVFVDLLIFFEIREKNNGRLPVSPLQHMAKRFSIAWRALLFGLANKVSSLIAFIADLTDGYEQLKEAEQEAKLEQQRLSNNERQRQSRANRLNRNSQNFDENETVPSIIEFHPSREGQKRHNQNVFEWES